MKVTPVVSLCLGALLLAGCEHTLTLQEAQAQCTKQGGFLVIIYTQKLTMSGLGPETATPGDCVSASKFDITPAASPPPASGAPVANAPQSDKPPASAN